MRSVLGPRYLWIEAQEPWSRAMASRRMNGGHFRRQQAAGTAQGGGEEAGYTKRKSYAENAMEEGDLLSLSRLQVMA